MNYDIVLMACDTHTMIACVIRMLVNVDLPAKSGTKWNFTNIQIQKIKKSTNRPEARNDRKMKYQISIDMDNAAFEKYPRVELSRVLIAFADRILAHAGATAEDLPTREKDYNGNTVLTAEVIE